MQFRHILIVPLLIIVMHKSQISQSLTYFYPRTQFCKHRSLEVGKALLQTFSTGNQSCLSPSIKKEYFRLGLGHLFTPSGLHIKILMSPFKILFGKKINTLLLMTLFFIFIFVKSYGCLRRTAFMRLCLLQKWQIIYCLIFTFIFDLFLIGQHDVFSFALSLLFLSILTLPLTRFQQLWIFFLANVTIAFLNETSHSLTSVILNLMVVPLFSICFPLILLANFSPSQALLSAMEMCLEKFHFILMDFFSSNYFDLRLTGFLISVLWIYFLFPFKRWVLYLIIFLHPLDIYEKEGKINFNSNYEIAEGSSCKITLWNGIRLKKCRYSKKLSFQK